MDNYVRKGSLTLGNHRRKNVEPAEESIQFVYEQLGSELQEVVAGMGDRTDWLQYCEDHHLVTLRNIYEKGRTSTP